MNKLFMIILILFSNILYADQQFYIPKKTLEAEKQLNYARNMIKTLQHFSKIPKGKMQKRIKEQLTSMLRVYPYPYFDPVNTISDTLNPKVYYNEAIKNFIIISDKYKFYYNKLGNRSMVINTSLQKKVNKLPVILQLVMYKKDEELFIKFFPELILNPIGYNQVTKYRLGQIEGIYLKQLEKINKIYGQNLKKYAYKDKIVLYLTKLDFLFGFLNKYNNYPQLKLLKNKYSNVLKNIYYYIYTNGLNNYKYLNFVNQLDEYVKTLFPYLYYQFYRKYFYYYYTEEKTKIN